MKNFIRKTKSGVTSLYVVIFATILFGVITLSFTRIIISESTQSSNDDLSRSAYDSALAGVEDAKIAVNRYYECLTSNTQEYCQSNYGVFSDEDDGCEDGFPLASVLHGIYGSGEVKIQETSSSGENSSDQAYTCVIITDVTPDYRGTLTADTRTKVIPLSIGGTSSVSMGNIANVKTVQFSWYSELNQGSTVDFANLNNGGKRLNSATSATIPPTIQLALIKTPTPINLTELYSEENTGNTIFSTMLLLPSESGEDQLTISADTIRSAGNVMYDATNDPFAVECSTGREFACIVNLEIDSLVTSNSDNVLLVASLPYGDAFTDFAVSLYDGSGNQIQLKGVQISVDSTGRTNQLFRRVETRLDAADLFFPYPAYALEVDGSDYKSILKNFWVTANCWSADGRGNGGYCNNNGEL